MPTPRGLVQQLDRYMHRSALLPRGARLLLAISGGADSVALLRLLTDINRSQYWGWQLVVGHVDHGMRGAESRADARFVVELAQSQGMELALSRLNLPGGASEDRARQARFRALGRMARTRRCIAVVTAHQADDQAETVLMRIFRGCGLEGLAAMSPDASVAGLRILRPLLHVRRDDLLEYLRGIGQEWREDATNRSSDYLRNRVRHELLPLATALWPGAVSALVRVADLAKETQALISGLVDLVETSSILRHDAKGVILCRRTLRKAPPLLIAELLRRQIGRAGGSSESADFERLREAVRMISGPHGAKHIEMGRGITVCLEGKEVQIIRRARPSRRRQ